MRKEIGRRVDNKFRRSNTSENLSVNDSGRQRPWAERNASNAAELRPDFGNRSRSLVLAGRQVKHPAKEKERRAPRVKRWSNSNSGNSNKSNGGSSYKNANSSSSSSKAARLVQPSAARRKARDAVSRKVETGDNQKKRHRQSRGKIFEVRAAPEPNCLGY